MKKRTIKILKKLRNWINKILNRLEGEQQFSIPDNFGPFKVVNHFAEHEPEHDSNDVDKSKQIVLGLIMQQLRSRIQLSIVQAGPIGDKKKVIGSIRVLVKKNQQ